MSAEHSAGATNDCPGEQIFRSPNRALLLTFLREAIGITCLWIVVYGGANWVTGLHIYRVRLWTDVELGVPFVPAAAVVYLSLFPMMWLAPFVLHRPDQLRTFARSLTWLIVLSGIGFLMLPADRAHPTQDAEGAFGKLLALADQLNMDYNYLPSLHVGMAVVCSYAYSQTGPRKSMVVFWLWTAAIAISTLLTHQHYLADVVSGAVLALLISTMCIPSITCCGKSE